MPEVLHLAVVASCTCVVPRVLRLHRPPDRAGFPVHGIVGRCTSSFPKDTENVVLVKMTLHPKGLILSACSPASQCPVVQDAKNVLLAIHAGSLLTWATHNVTK